VGTAHVYHFVVIFYILCCTSKVDKEEQMTRTYNTSPSKSERVTERLERNQIRAHELQEKRKRLNIIKRGQDQYAECQSCGAFIKMHKLTQSITEIERQNRIERVKKGLLEVQRHIVPTKMDTVPLYPDPLLTDKQVCGKCYDLSYSKKYYYITEPAPS
jgi:RNA polymerase-binding transcription factor DksA